MKKMRLLVILSLIASSVIYGEIKLDSSKLQNTTIEQGKKGNTIINVNTPNRKGVSVNDFENFQTKNGVIFNNAGQRMNISQLEGIINGNSNITGDQAKLILNRVNGTNRTEIEGAMEAVGRNKVDMIFSSLNGIYLDGAKFIGFKNVTFTTAPVNLDREGNIQTLTIDRGDIEVGRKGLDASKLEQLALLSKKISVNGFVEGKSLDFIAGEFDYNVNENIVEKSNDVSNLINISLSEFGSIYGDQITLVSKDGDIGIKGDIIAISGVNIYGRIIINEGNIYSQIKNTIKAKSLENTGNIYGYSVQILGKGAIEKNGNIYGEDISIYNITLNENSIIANNYLQVFNEQVESYTNKGYLYSGGDMDLKWYWTVSGTFYNEGTIEVKNNLKTTHISNIGNIKVGKDMEIKDVLINNGTLEINNIKANRIENTGIILGEETLNIKTERLINKGDIKADNLFIDSKNIKNTGYLSSLKNMELKAEILEHTGRIETNTLKLTTKEMELDGYIKAKKISFENYPE